MTSGNEGSALKGAALALAGFVLLVLAVASPALAQTTISTGSIQGTITDPSGAVVPGAKITITNRATGQVVNLTSSASGTYSSGALAPGDYVVQVTAQGFKRAEVGATVQIGNITRSDLALQVGSESVVVEVTAAEARVNTEQASVQGVLTAQEIEQLPVNGRNFLDLASLEPGVQIQDGATFDPTKNGYSSISFAGRFGRTARIELDGVDISDETVGTTTQNIPQSSIQEFQVSQSTLDVSTELTSSGTVNVVTRSGTNILHGQAYYYGRSDQISARIAPKQLDFGRKQFGGSLGGAFLKNRLFFFGDVERTDQALTNPVTLNGVFASSSGSFGAPFTERDYVGKVDWNIKKGWTMFYRFSYNQNKSVRGFNPGVYQPFANVDHTPSHAVGTDFTTRKFTHSIRFQYLKFRNAIADAVAGSGIYNPAAGLSINITPSGGDFTCLAGGENFCSGQNILAPQATYQTDKQIKYDGGYIFAKHILRYGANFNDIQGGGFAKFFALAPMVRSIFNSTSQSTAVAGTFTCPNGTTGASCALNWPIDTILVANGQGFFTETPSFGAPAGGQHDYRFQWYVEDKWKARSNLTLMYGVHYNHDTGRTDSDLTPISALAQFNNQFFSGLERRVAQPDLNFGPVVGIAWDPWGNGKTSIRVGSGIYFENAIFNNVLFDRPGRLLKGLFAAQVAPCFGGSPNPIQIPGGPLFSPTFCGQAIGTATGQIVAFNQQYQAAVAALGQQNNPNFVGTTLQANNINGIQMFAPSYRSPYSFQLNVGVERQFGKGTILSVNYLRNVGLHYLIAYDTNKVGDARFLNVVNAQNAISATNGSFAGCPANFSAAATTCAILAGATIVNYASRGLDSGFDSSGGAPCPTCAFPGINPNLGQNEMLFPAGRSLYNALQVSLKSRLDHPLPTMRHAYVIVSYALSRFEGLVQDQDFVTNATDFNNPLKFFGPTSLDRTSQLGVGAIMDFPWATQIALTTHWNTAGPLTLFLPQSGLPGEIFRTDVTGDGTVGDVVPGTNVGAFGRSITAGTINAAINKYSNAFGGQLTPASQALVAAGLFSATQLQQLCAFTPTINSIPANCLASNPALQLAAAPPGQVGVSPVFTFDIQARWNLRLSKVLHVLPERVILQPQVAVFNVFNYQNHDPFGNLLSGVLSGAAGTVNGTTAHNAPGCGPTPPAAPCTGRSSLVTPGSSSGVNWYAVPRQAEFGVKLTF
jgi:hypothetical protein